MEIPWAADLARLGIATFFLDRRGHGQSAGNLWPSRVAVPKLDNLEPDVRAALAYVRSLAPLIDPRRVAILGHSDGASAAINAASADWEIRATVAVSASVAEWQLVNHVAPRDLLLVYGADDRFIVNGTDTALIQRATRGYLDGVGEFGNLADGSARRLVRVPGRGHLDVISDDSARRVILGWLKESLQTRGEVSLSEGRAGWLISGVAASLVALTCIAHLFVGRRDARRRASAFERPQLSAPRPARWLYGLLLCTAWSLGLLLSPWLASQLRMVVPAQEGAVFVAQVLGAAVGLVIIGGALACIYRQKADERELTTLAGIASGVIGGAVASAALLAVAYLLFLHHYEIIVTARRLVLLPIFGASSLPASFALENWLHWRGIEEEPLLATAWLLLMAAATTILSSVLFQRMSMAPGHLLAAALVISAAYHAGIPSCGRIAPAVGVAFTLGWMGAVGGALY